MRRSRPERPTWPELVAGMLGMLWRCRLELTVTGGILLAFLLLAGLVGDLVAGVWVVGLVAVVVAVPRVRGWLLHALRAARVRRAWWRAWTDCELPRVRAGRISTIPAGELIRVRASRESSLEHVEHRAEELAVCLQAREVRVGRDPDNAATGTVTLVRRDPLAGNGLGVVASPRCRSAVAVGPDPDRRRRAGRDGLDLAAGTQRADGRRTGRRQERGAVGAGRHRGARPEHAGVAARWQARGAVGVGALRTTPGRSGRR